MAHDLGGRFPQGGDLTHGQLLEVTASGSITIIKSDRRICIQDNGTPICDLNHKLKFPGTCFNQPIGTFNSTDPTFQPGNPICLVDYESSGFNSALILSSAPPERDTFSANLGEIFGSHPQFSLLEEVERTHDLFKQSIFIQSSDTFIGKVVNQVTSFYKTAAVPFSVSSFWRMAQFNPGDIRRDPGVFSDLFSLDVASFFNVFKSLTFFMIETLAARLKQQGEITGFSGNIINTDFVVSSSDDICVGDDDPPVITYISPTQSGTLLAPRDQIVDFSLTDLVGGVDIASINITIDSTVSGTFPLILNGADQTGGDVSTIGDQNSFRFIYTPPFLWEFNEQVTVLISGSDLPPQVDGNPFFCGAAKVNDFVGDIKFQVLNKKELPATIVGIGDVDPPFLSFLSPGSGTTDNSIFAPVTIRIADGFTGVELSSIFVNINTQTIIQDGIPTTNETIIFGTPAEFTIIHTPTSAFIFNSAATVVVNAADRNEDPEPNLLSTNYTFSFIDEGTLIIENFSPQIGTTSNLPAVNIEADIRDDTFGVNEEQSFFVINGTIVSGTRTPLASGIQLSHHPPNDFDFKEPVRVTVHAVNNNVLAPVVKESFFTLFFGYRLTFFNEEPYEHGTNVDVFIRARNIELLHKDLSTGYFFTTFTQPQKDLSAEIFAINPTKNLSASLVVIAPEHRFGETVTVEFFIKDFEGHDLGPILYTYTIENKP